MLIRKKTGKYHRFLVNLHQFVDEYRNLQGYFASNQRQYCFAYFVARQMGGTRFLGNLVRLVYQCNKQHRLPHQSLCSCGRMMSYYAKSVATVGYTSFFVCIGLKRPFQKSCETAQAGTDKTVLLRTCNLGRLRRDRSFVWRHLAVSGSIYCRRGAVLLLEELDEM